MCPRVEELSTLCMELDNIKVELYSAPGKPKSSQAELENEIAGNGNESYCEFITSLPRFEDNKKVDLAKYFNTRNCLKTQGILRNM